MTLRQKLVFAQAPLVLALVVSGVAGSLVTRELGQSSREILKDNYRSVLAAQRMKDSLERMDSGALFTLAGHGDDGRAQIATHRRRVEAELATQEGNITEAGELEATRLLRRAWDAYQVELDGMPAAYFERVLPAFERVKAAAETVLETNQDAMVRKSDRAERASARLNGVLLLVALVGCVLAVLASSALTARLLRPLTVLGHVARRLGEGELDARARLPGSDEIAALARELDTMAEHLEKYRKSSLGELLEAQQAAQAAMDSLPDPILVVGIDGRLSQVNRAAEDVLGVNLEEPGHDTLATLEPETRKTVERVREHVLAGKGAYAPRGLEEATRLGDRDFLPRATPVYSAEGAVFGSTVVLQDVTRLRRFDELKNNLVATVAHELRTPLTSLRMAIHLCIEGTVGPLTEKQADLLQAGREDCERLQATVDELLDLSRIQAGRMELRLAATEVEGLVNDAVDASRTQADPRGIALRVEVLPGMGTVNVDADRIGLALGNLVGNAIRHSPDGGTVVVRAVAEEGGVRFEVADEGPGVPPELQDRIFEKYARGSTPGGAGLGLYLAKEIVEAHGGRIGVRSDGGGGVGSVFWFAVGRGA